VHKLLSAFGSHAVFTAGLLVAGAFTLGAFRVVAAVRALPELQRRG
jgi:AAA family ATP:ADP antiporter